MTGPGHRSKNEGEWRAARTALKSQGLSVFIKFVTVAAMVAAGLLRQDASAHHGPEAVIAVLTERLDKQGAAPGLLYKRAIEWNILGKLDNAIDDLDAALNLKPDFDEGIQLLSQVYLRKGDTAQAAATARLGIERGTSPEDIASSQMALAQALREAGKVEAALHACDDAFATYPSGNIDWFLIRGSMQRRLGHHQKRIDNYTSGYERTHSIVLRNAVIDAKIDAGRASEVMELLDKQVAECRLKSRWLLRRGRALLSLGRTDAAAIDLAAAISEIDTRIHPLRPDVTLIIDRGIARALLGNHSGAASDLAKAQAMDVSPYMLDLLVQVLTPEEVDSASADEDANS